MDRPDGLLARLRFELDDTHATEVRPHPVHIRSHPWHDGRVRRPQRVLVRLALVPEAAAVELPIGQRDRSEVRVAAALPVHVLERLVLCRGHLEVGVAEHDVAGIGEPGQAGMWRLQGDPDAPVVGGRPERAHGPTAYGAAVVVGATPASEVVGAGGSDVTTTSDAFGNSRICPAKIWSGLTMPFFSMIRAIGNPNATAISVSVSLCCTA